MSSSHVTPLNVEVVRATPILSSSSSTSIQYNPEIVAAINRHERSRTVGAGIVGGVVGFVVGGPIGAAIFGFGTSYYAHQPANSSAAGDAARAMGDVALKARDQAIALDEKHQLLDQTQQMATETYQKTLEFNEKYSVVEKTKLYAKVSFQWMLSTTDYITQRITAQKESNEANYGEFEVIDKDNNGEESENNHHSSLQHNQKGMFQTIKGFILSPFAPKQQQPEPLHHPVKLY